MQHEVRNGVVVKKISVSELPEAVREDTSPEGKAMAEALCYECSVELDVGPEGELQKSLCVQGGDRAAGHAAFALDSCIHKDGVCMRCLLRKRNGAWTKQEDCDAAVRRGAVLQSLLCHCDPRPRMKGYENIAPLKCPCCLVPVTPELMKKEADEYAELSENKQKEYRSKHSKTPQKRFKQLLETPWCAVNAPQATFSCRGAVLSTSWSVLETTE